MTSRPRSAKSRPSALRSRITLGCLVLTVTIQPLAAQRPAPPQRGGAPKPDTPQLVVSTLASSDATIGVAAADAIRRRIQSEHTATDLYIVPAQKINDALVASGFPPDSSLGKTDLMALTKQVRGDYALDGTVERTTDGMKTSIRLLTQTGPQVVAEPLVAIVGSDLGDIAKKVDRAVSEAIRALSFNHECRRAALVGDYKQAMAAAQQGLKIRPTSTALNLCALSILAPTHASPDSIIGVASAIVSVDSANTVAWANLVDAYAAKGDAARQLDATRMLRHADSTNVTVTLSLVDQLVVAGQPESALAVLDTALGVSPANAQLLAKKWLAELRVAKYAEALRTGDALIAADSAAATEDFFRRQLLAATNAHDTTASHRVAVQASARYPKNVDFLLTLARDGVNRNAPRDALGFADRVLSVEPANQLAWQVAITAQAAANGTDSAVATARHALASAVTKEAVGGSLLAVITPALEKAQTGQTRADWEAVLTTAQAVDSVASTPRSEFYIGVAAYQIGRDVAQSLADGGKRGPTTRAERQTMCASATRVEDLVGIATVALSKGGSVDPAVATQILTGLPSLSEFVTSVKQVSCRRD
jgi:tetratricopeptide (TPR) repeat protein